MEKNDENNSTKAGEKLMGRALDYNIIFNAVSNGMAFTEFNTGKIIDVNTAWTRNTGISREQAVGNTALDFGLWADVKEREACINEIIKNGSVTDFEVRLRINYEDLLFLISAEIVEMSGKLHILWELRNISELKKINESLIKSEEKYRTIIDTSNDGFWVTDANGNLTQVNDAYCKMSGYSEKELLSMSVLDLEVIDPETIPKRSNEFTNKGYTRFETKHKRKDGTIFDVEVYVQSLTGKRDIIFSFTRDITDRKKAEKALRESEEKYRTLFEGSRDAIMTLAPPEWLFTSCNKAAVDLFRMKSEAEFVSFSPWQLSPENQPGGKPSGKKAKEMIDIAIQNGSHFFEWVHCYSDGTPFPAEVLLTRVEQKGQVLIHATVRDITNRKQVENILKQSEEQLRLFIQQTPASVAMFDRNMCYIAASSRWISAYHLGISNTDIIGLSHYEVFPEISARLKEIHKLGMNGEISRADEDSFERLDGTIQWVMWEVRPWYRTDDSVGGIIILSEDITNRKQEEEKRLDLEKRLTQAQKMESIGTLAGGIAHDFNNILSPIMLHAEMMMDDLPSDDPLQHDVREIYKAGARARDLVQQILTFARKKSEEKIVLRSSQVVKEAIKFLRSTIPTTIDIQYHIEAEQDTVLADPTQLNQIIMNLCTNAAHAMREKGGLLELSLSNEYVTAEKLDGVFKLIPGKSLKLSVRDSGTGISPENIGRIFEPYFTTKGPGEGTGLGLAIIHGIIQNSGGAIHVESKVGEGTTFNVYLPLVEDLKPLADEKDVEIPKGTEQILMVDDEESILNVNHKMLTKLGYKVTAKTSSMEVLEIFSDSPESFDLVITDMTMPNISGKILATEIKKIRPDIPVILCTGFSDQIDEKEAKEIGINAFILKPISRNEIANTMRKVLDKAYQEKVVISVQ